MTVLVYMIVIGPIVRVQMGMFGSIDVRMLMQMVVSMVQIGIRMNMYRTVVVFMGKQTHPI